MPFTNQLRMGTTKNYHHVIFGLITEMRISSKIHKARLLQINKTVLRVNEICFTHKN